MIKIERLDENRSKQRVDQDFVALPRAIHASDILRDATLRLVIRGKNPRLEHEKTTLLGHHICWRATKGQRRAEPAVVVEDPQCVTPGFPHKDSLLGRVRLQQGDDRTALESGNEGTGR